MTKITASVKVSPSYRITIPAAVQRALDVGPSDRVTFVISEGAEVEIQKSKEDHLDRSEIEFLKLLATDIDENPNRLSVLRRKSTFQAELEVEKMSIEELDRTAGALSEVWPADWKDEFSKDWPN